MKIRHLAPVASALALRILLMTTAPSSARADESPSLSSSPVLASGRERRPAPGAAVLAHGGAGTTADRSPLVAPAAEAAWRVLAEGGSALDAAIAGTMLLEDEPEFNAGTGSNIRMDGETVQMDAAVMDASGDFGAVAVIEGVRNPVLVAREVMRSPHLLMAGEGATRLARAMGLPEYDPRTPESRERFGRLLARMRDGRLGSEWRGFDWRERWNFRRPASETLELPSDTVGVVARDGRGDFAAAISTGGTSVTLMGRVGDVPIFGAGIYASAHGVVCTTGWGEYIVRENLARRVHDWMTEGATPDEALARGLALYPPEVGIGLIVLGAPEIAYGGEDAKVAEIPVGSGAPSEPISEPASKRDWAAGSNTTMAWAGIVDGARLDATGAAKAAPSPIDSRADANP